MGLDDRIRLAGIAAVTVAWGAVGGVAVGTQEVVRVECEATNGPVVLPWKTVTPDPAYHGCWLVCGDLDGDKQAEMVTARRIPRTQYVAAAVATKLDGTVLWRWGTANAGEAWLACDVPVQCYDRDGDGLAEVYLVTGKGAEDNNGRLLVLDGRTGKPVREIPLMPPNKESPSDCITFANLRGGPRAKDILLKSRHEGILALTDEGKQLWKWISSQGECAHHALPVDTDGDGRDEVFTGRCLLSPDGKELWPHEMPVGGSTHVDSCRTYRVENKPEDVRFAVSGCRAKYVALLDHAGTALWKQSGYHYESVEVGRLRSDIPGMQVVTDIDKLPFGKSRLCMFDDRGKMVADFTCGDARFFRLLDWDGDGLLDILIVQSRKVFHGWGKCLAELGPKESWPSAREVPLGLVADMDGDERPEIILHHETKILVYKGDRVAKVPGRSLGTHNFTLY